MNKFFFIIFFLFPLDIYCQYNHVVNGDFEQYTECPNYVSTPGDYQLERCYGWKVPSYATSDYYNACSNPSIIGVPYNATGRQIAHSGIGYCGFFAYDYDFPLGYSYWHEYIQGTINPPLEGGRVYQVSYYVNLAETSRYSSSKLGAYLSEDAISSAGAAPFNLTPQIINPANNFISDTSNWVIISGYYLASGGEKYITLGWWGDSLEFDTLRFYPAFSGVDSYYYVDDVSIVDTNSHFIAPNVFTPNDDGINDFWFPSSYKMYKMQVWVYNRWGTLVFKGDENNYIWDGNAGEQPCSDGTYFYILQGLGEDQKKYNEKGFIQLLR